MLAHYRATWWTWLILYLLNINILLSILTRFNELLFQVFPHLVFSMLINSFGTCSSTRKAAKIFIFIWIMNNISTCIWKTQKLTENYQPPAVPFTSIEHFNISHRTVSCLQRLTLTTLIVVVFRRCWLQWGDWPCAEHITLDRVRSSWYS